MRGQHRPAEPLVKAIKRQGDLTQEFMSRCGVATCRGEKAHVKGLEGPKHSSIHHRPETETAGYQIDWVKPQADDKEKSHRLFREVSS